MPDLRHHVPALMKKRTYKATLPSLTAVIAIALLTSIVRYTTPPTELNPEALASAGIILLSEPRTLPKAALTNSDSQAFGPTYFAGKWTLVLFGYTYCPDICPTALSELKRIRASLPEKLRQRLQVTMVSVDPARDTPERLSQYLAYFDGSFTGMSGTLEEVQIASTAMGLPFVPGDTHKPHYTVAHSGNLALIAPDGRQAGYVRGPLQERALIQRLPQLLTLTTGHVAHTSSTGTQ